MKKTLSTLFLSSALLLTACATDQPAEETPTTTEDSTTEEVVDETPVDETTEEPTDVEPVEVTMVNSDNEESGTVTLTETEEGVQLTYELHNLPEGEFAMHVHETGSATAPDFEDAGSHWNPTDVEHGTDSETGPHLGDLPNIEVDSSGEISGEELLENVTLAEEAPEGKYSLHNDGQGTALIVHEGADDYVSQPTGDAGGRQLGGVIIPSSDSASE
jgi:Cu-Zn family superoxide dismutase